ncbi:MAG: hypothetical protein ACI8ZM_004113 [Crocinitomix sp.]|jgi:hypothetical protein
MFKNIELSEINQLAVRKSLSVTFSVFFVGVFIFGCVDSGLGLGLYLLIGMLLYGLIVWVPIVIVVTLIERFVLRNRSRELTVIALFLFELLLPFFIILFFSDQRELDLGLGLIMILTIGQILRWIYLRFTNKMFNSIKLNTKNLKYENQ